MAHSEVPGTLPGERRDATPEPAGEAAALFSDRTAEDWMLAAGSCRRSAEPAARGWLWRSRAVRRWRVPDSVPPGFVEASTGFGPLVAPPAVAPAFVSVEREPCLQ